MDYAKYLLSLPISELKAVRKAINVLVRAGVTREAAITIIVDAKQRQYTERRSYLG